METLKISFPPEYRLERYGTGVEFAAKIPGQRRPVLCVISREALEDGFAADRQGLQGLTIEEAFLKYRAVIEAIAERKIQAADLSHFDCEGRVRITTADCKEYGGCAAL